MRRGVLCSFSQVAECCLKSVLSELLLFLLQSTWEQTKSNILKKNILVTSSKIKDFLLSVEEFHFSKDIGHYRKKEISSTI